MNNARSVRVCNVLTLEPANSAPKGAGDGSSPIDGAFAVRFPWSSLEARARRDEPLAPCFPSRAPVDDPGDFVAGEGAGLDAAARREDRRAGVETPRDVGIFKDARMSDPSTTDPLRGIL